MKPPIGRLVMATVDGQDACIYTSLETEEKGDNRKFCYRYAPPSNAIVPRDAAVVITHQVESFDTSYARSFRKE